MIEKLVLSSNLLFKYFGAISINYFVSFLLAVLEIFGSLRIIFRREKEDFFQQKVK